MKVVKTDSEEGLPDHLGRWLEAASRRFFAEVGRERWDGPEVRGSHRRVLQMVPAGGMRVTDLAQRAGMTKQSLGELVDHLEQSGLVSTERSTTDRRVRIVQRTPLGDDAVAATTRVMAQVERRWRSELGGDRFDQFKQVLRELGAGSFAV
jgi:DNA-binding MarR family transcriptional regulator